MTFGHSWLETAPRERQKPFHFLHTSDGKQICTHFNLQGIEKRAGRTHQIAITAAAAKQSLSGGGSQSFKKTLDHWWNLSQHWQKLQVGLTSISIAHLNQRCSWIIIRYHYNY